MTVKGGKQLIDLDGNLILPAREHHRECKEREPRQWDKECGPALLSTPIEIRRNCEKNPEQPRNLDRASEAHSEPVNEVKPPIHDGNVA